MDVTQYSEPDQKLRHKRAVEANNQRVLDIESIYQGENLKGKTVVVTGANRGLGAQVSFSLLKSAEDLDGSFTDCKRARACRCKGSSKPAISFHTGHMPLDTTFQLIQVWTKQLINTINSVELEKC